MFTLASRRELKFSNGFSLRTPILIPSFSSRIPKVENILRAGAEFIDGPVLVSAYDVKHQNLIEPFDIGSAVFLDSGGYEASTDSDLSDVSGPAKGSNWTLEEYCEVLAAWTSTVPLVVVSFDHPKLRQPIAKQIRSALRLELPSSALREILLKPETPEQNFVKIESIQKSIHALSQFQAIGITEKECGSSVFGRMEHIARMRIALDGAGISCPIHVFGSLDTITTLFYFVAGADIFDGLTWLRYAFKNGQTLYRQDFGITDIGIDVRFAQVEAVCWSRNYQYMREMELEMRRFLISHDFGVFKHHSEKLRDASQSLEERLRS